MLRRYLVLGFGWVFILLGILGLFLPVLQGILFLSIGLILLSSESVRLRWLIMKLGQRFPIFRKALTVTKGKARVWRARLRARPGARRSGGD